MSKIQTDRFPTITMAFRLGWSLSELMGRTRHAWLNDQGRAVKPPEQQLPKELRGFADDQAPRLTCSNRYFSSQGAWWQAALRVTSFAQQLGVLDKESEIDRKIQELPNRVYTLTFEPDTVGEQPFPSPRDFYNLLEPWSRQVGVRLAAQSDQAALAFRVGNQIADTYWFMRGEEGYGQPRDKHKQDSWHQLLNHKRLITMVEDLKRLDPHLPPLVSESLRFSISRWGIAHDLESRKERLTLVRGKNNKDSQVERERGGILKKIEPNHEKQIVEQLEEQAQIWQELILGTRRPESYLNRKRRCRALLQALLRYLLIIAMAIFLLSLAGYVFVILLGGVLSSGLGWVWQTLIPDVLKSDTLKTSLEIVTKALPLISGAIVFLASLVRDGWSGMRGLWERLYQSTLALEIKNSTWVPVLQPGFLYRLRYWRKTD